VPTTTTEQFVKSEYDRVLADVCRVIPLHRWKHQPTGLDFTTHKSKYGMATPAGQVLINRAFVGTTAVNKLDFTLRHEFAHLAIGLVEHHNRRFRRIEACFGADVTRDLTAEQSQVMGAIGNKYTLIAHLVDGREIDLGGANRRTARYINYPNEGRLNRSFRGVKIERFEYRPREGRGN
jgi:hypothetical protein